MTPKKIDKRMLGYGMFKYHMSFARREADRFILLRNWCWQQWGPSSEIEFYHLLEDSTAWSWVSDHHARYRIFFQSDKEYAWFMLNWGNQ